MPVRLLWPLVAVLLRRADRRRARNVHSFVAISQAVADRIRRFYGREAIVIHPPVDTEFFTPDPAVRKRDYFLYAGRLVAYKQPEIAVYAARAAGVPLVVAGSGPEIRNLRKAAGPDVMFQEDPSREELRHLYRTARALVFPGEEDFGIVMAESLACGTPVIAFAKGGAEEIVCDGKTGVLYEKQTVECLAQVLRNFDHESYHGNVIRQSAEKFRGERFDEQFRAHVLSCIAASTKADAASD